MVNNAIAKACFNPFPFYSFACFLRKFAQGLALATRYWHDGIIRWDGWILSELSIGRYDSEFYRTSSAPQPFSDPAVVVSVLGGASNKKGSCTLDNCAQNSFALSALLTLAPVEREMNHVCAALLAAAIHEM
jgi:hypothetical protein